MNNRDNGRRSGQFQHDDDRREQHRVSSNERGWSGNQRDFRGSEHHTGERDWRSGHGEQRGGERDWHGEQRGGQRDWRGERGQWRSSGNERGEQRGGFRAGDERNRERGDFRSGEPSRKWQSSGAGGYPGSDDWRDDDRYRDRSRPQPHPARYDEAGSRERGFRQYASGGALPRGGFPGSGVGDWNRGESREWNRGEDWNHGGEENRDFGEHRGGRQAWEEQGYGSHGERGYGTPQYGYGPSGYGSSGSGTGYGNRDYRGSEGGYGASGSGGGSMRPSYGGFSGGGRGFHGVGSFFGGNHGSYDTNYGSDFGGPGAGQRGDLRRDQQNPSGQGSHRGRGPAGYNRSDDRIKEDVSDALTDHEDVDASEIEVTVKSGEVTLSGTVEARYMKRLAEDIAERVRGVRDVRNELRVKQDARGSSGTASTRSTGTSATASSGTSNSTSAAGQNPNANGTRASS
jgi:hypothetical protein